METQPKKHKIKILYASFNRDYSCLSLGMQFGYRIYDLTKKDTLFFYERNLGKGIGIIEMLEKTCILGLVGGGNNPYYGQNQVNIYDDREGKIIAELKFKNKVLNIRLKKDRILVVCENYIYIITLANLKSIDSINLGEDNKKRVTFAFCLDQEVNKLAYNKINNLENKIIINSYNAENQKKSIELKTNYKQNNFIKFMEFNKKAQLIAISPINYQYLDLYNTENGLIICKCKLDSDSLNVKYISFSQEDDFFCCFLNSSEVNIFNIKSSFNIQEGEEELIKLNQNDNKNMKIKIWSKFYLPENEVICCFANFMENEIGKGYIICIGNKGNYYLVKFDKDKSEDLSLKVCEKYFLKNDVEY